MATVACKVPNGLALRLFKTGYDDGTGDGVCPVIQDGPGFRLAGPRRPESFGVGATERDDLLPGLTEVPDDWIARWFDQNKLNPLVSTGMVYVLGPGEAPAGAPGSEPPAAAPEAAGGARDSAGSPENATANPTSP